MKTAAHDSSGTPKTHAPIATLIVFCRRPQPGHGKRRIARELGDPQTAAIAQLLMACTVEDAAAWTGPIIIAPARPEDRHWASQLLPGRAEVIVQPAGNLGERINAIDAAVLAGGHPRRLFIGSDSPTLTPAYFKQAAAALNEADVVLGPAEDGGVTLMGTTDAWPNLADLPWSTASLGTELERACIAAGQSVAQLGAHYDIDRIDDLNRLQNDLADDTRPARQALRSWLQENLPADMPQDAGKPRISLVIPVLGDYTELRELLREVSDLSARPFETIVVDGGNDERIASLCADHECVHMAARAGRGHQMNAGASRASGDVIWFLHADAHPPADAIEKIRAGIDAGLTGGYFRFRFAGRPAWHKSLMAGLINWRCRYGTPYGDQGLFIRRKTFLDIDGFDDIPLFEEVRFVRAARAAGRFDALDSTLDVSARRWERDGWLRRTVQNRLLAIGHLLGISPNRLARLYGRAAAAPTDSEAKSC